MRRMYEFDSVSVSSFEAGSLVDHLSARSADGWDVVAIVPAGSNVVAYLRRDQPAADAADASTPPSMRARRPTARSTRRRPVTPRAPRPRRPTLRPPRRAPPAGARAASRRRRRARPRRPAPRRGTPGRARPPAAGPIRNSSRRRPARRRPRRRPRSPPDGTPIRPAASSCATGTARRGPSTCLAAVSSPPTRRSPDRPATPRLLTAVPGPCASRRSARPACSSRPPTAASCAIRGSCRRSSRRGSCSRATTSSTPDCSSASNRPTTCTCHTSTATTSTRCGWPITCRGTSRSSSPATRPASSTSGCAPSASPSWCARRRATSSTSAD